MFTQTNFRGAISGNPTGSAMAIDDTEAMKGTHGRERPRPVRLLLINPRFPESFWSFRWGIDKVLTDRRAVNPPPSALLLWPPCAHPTGR